MHFFRLLLTGFAGLAISPAFAAQDQWSHPDTGITIDRTSKDFSLSQEYDSSGAKLDNILKFNGGGDIATIYLYRSSFPNPVLWFPRTKAAMAINMRGLPEISSEPVPVTIGGGTSPNGLRWVTPLPGTAQPRATGVVIAQWGEWILKFRVTSLTRDADAVGKRLDQLIGMVHFSTPPAAPLPLKTPAPCTAQAWNNGMLMTDAPNDDELAAAMLVATEELGAARGIFGLAKEPDQWCHDESLTIGSGTIGLYRSLKKPSEWVMLMGDSGIGVAAHSFQDYAKLSKPKKLRAKAALYVSTTKATFAVAMFDNIPLAEAAIDLAMPVAMGQRSGIFSISTGTTPAAPSPNQNKGK